MRPLSTIISFDLSFSLCQTIEIAKIFNFEQFHWNGKRSEESFVFDMFKILRFTLDDIKGT